MKGIILAGGEGTRLYPVTKVICKQLLPVYDKPMIYYPMSVLMLARIREILIISTEEDLPKFRSLFGNGDQLGLSISYRVQQEPRGLADAFLVGEDYIDGNPVCLILGDNIFYGHGLPEIIQSAREQKEGATIFGYYVNDPERYGIVELDENQKVKSLEEKPEKPKSNYAITGLYFYDDKVVEKAKMLKPSKRGELEITDLNRAYLDEDKLQAKLLGRGFAWLDTGTHSSMVEATTFIKTIEDRQGLKVACIEEIAYKMGYIDKKQLKRLSESLIKSNYGKYLNKVIEE